MGDVPALEVGSVFRLIADGWTIDRVVSRFPNLTREDVSACLEYAVELLERDALRAEMRRRIADAKAHPERGIPHEDVMRELFEGLPEDRASDFPDGGGRGHGTVANAESRQRSERAALLDEAGLREFLVRLLHHVGR